MKSRIVRTLTAVLAAALVLSVFGCGDKETDTYAWKEYLSELENSVDALEKAAERYAEDAEYDVMEEVGKVMTTINSVYAKEDEIKEELVKDKEAFEEFTKALQRQAERIKEINESLRK